MSKTGDRLRTLSGYWQPMGLGHTLMDIAKMADKEVDDALATKPIVGVDAKPLKVGETVYGDDGKAWTIDGFDHGNEHSVVAHGEGGVRRQLRPEWLTHDAPVLAADGKPLEVGQTVWNMNGNEHVVASIDHGKGRFQTKRQEEGGGGWSDPLCFTHQRPVLDADGVPIKVGDAVWPKYSDSDPRNAVESAEVVYVHRRGRVDVQATYATGLSFNQQVDAKQLTHTKPESPDSWEKVEEDAKKTTCAYFGMEEYGYGCSECPVKHWKESCDEVKSKDLVRRCEKLAGVDE